MVDAYQCSSRRLLVLGYNATLTAVVEAPKGPRRVYDQLKSLVRVSPSILASIQELCRDPGNVVIIFSGERGARCVG